MNKTYFKPIQCERGNESLQTVMIMAVGALILIGVNSLFRMMAPKIQSYVQAVLTGEPGGSSGGLSLGSSSATSPVYAYPQDRVTGEPSAPLPNAPNASKENPDAPLPSWFSKAAQDQMPKQLADASKAIGNAIASELKEHLQVTLPTEAAYLEGVIDDLIEARDQLDPLSANRRAIEEEISALRRLSHKDLTNVMEGIEGRITSYQSFSPVFRALGAMFNVDSVLDQDRKNQALGRDPNTTDVEAYKAYLDTFRISSGVLVDGVINAATRGGANPGRASQITNNPGIQVAIGLAADRAGLAIAESAFPSFNSMAYWLYDNGYVRQDRQDSHEIGYRQAYTSKKVFAKW